MEIESVRTNFQEQLSKTEKQITELEENLTKLKEYKLKLIGGLETLDLLNTEEPTESES